MGIVVTVIMLVGLLVLLPRQSEGRSDILSNHKVVRISSILLLLGGLWNSAWYGLQHADQFWGLAALGSGLVMMATAIALLSNIKSKTLLGALGLLMLGFFLLYLVTLVQINLGIEYLR